MSKADLLRLLELVPYGIAASAVVAVLALYELLAPNPRSRARRGKPTGPLSGSPGSTQQD